jgi:hypothetical protein
MYYILVSDYVVEIRFEPAPMLFENRQIAAEALLKQKRELDDQLNRWDQEM